MKEFPEDEQSASATVRGFAPGQKVGGNRFCLRKELGRGGMGVVWLAEDERFSGEKVALKFLTPEFRSNPAFLADMRQETKQSRKLSHVNIVRIHDFHEAAGEDPFISMEFVDGQTLSTISAHRPARLLDWEYLKGPVRQLCDALEYAHSEDVIHRDIKPTNLMLDHRGQIKLADFGIAAVVKETEYRITGQHRTSGTPAYMSPQQLDGKPPSRTDDVYSLGASLFELLTSQPPFRGSDIPHLIRYVAPDAMPVRLKELRRRNNIPPEVHETVAACLDKDPSKRPQSASELCDRLGLTNGRTQHLRRSSFSRGYGGKPGKPAVRWRLILKIELLVCGAGLLVAGVADYFGPRYFPAYLMARQAGSSTPARTQPAAKPAPEPKVAVAPPESSNAIAVISPPPVVTSSPPVVATPEPVPEAVVSAEPVAPQLPGPGRGWTNQLGMQFVPVEGLAVLVSVWETRVADFQAYLEQTQRPNRARSAGFTQTAADPVVLVRWDEAKAFCEWLTGSERKSGRLGSNQVYRLPTDEEWSRAAGLVDERGSNPKEKSGKNKKRFVWGEGFPPPAGAGNFAGLEVRSLTGQRDWPVISKYQDKFPVTAPAGSFSAGNGLFDLGGNVWEWCEDWADPTHHERVCRGAAWDTSETEQLYASFRYSLGPQNRLRNVGFRCVLAVAEPSVR